MIRIKRKSIILLMMSFVMPATLLMVATNRNYSEYNVNPKPGLTGKLEWPEYLEGGCFDYKYVESIPQSYAMPSPPLVIRSIAVKSLDNNSDFWTKAKTLLTDDLGWIVDTFSKNADEKSSVSTNYLLSLSLDQSDWNSQSANQKHSLLEGLLELLMSEGEEANQTMGEVYIYRCDNEGHAKWTAYAKLSRDGQRDFYFDW